MIHIATMPDAKEQRQLLFALQKGGGYGILCILQTPGDVVFAASPVPRLAGYEIVCASSNRLYDIWKNGKLIAPDQTREQIKEWIRENTPEWLYDDSTPTRRQKKQVASWVAKFRAQYPGTFQVITP